MNFPNSDFLNLISTHLFTFGFKLACGKNETDKGVAMLWFYFSARKLTSFALNSGLALTPEPARDLFCPQLLLNFQGTGKFSTVCCECLQQL